MTRLISPLTRLTEAQQATIRLLAVRSRLAGWNANAIRTRARRIEGHARPNQALAIWWYRVTKPESYHNGLPYSLKQRSFDLTDVQLQRRLDGTLRE